MMRSRPRPASPRLTGLVLLLALACATAAPAEAQLRGVGYRFSPTAGYVSFEDNAGLTDGFLYGGGLGLSFGEFVELGGLYLVGNDFETDFSGFSGLEDDTDLAGMFEAIPAREVDVRRYGGELTLRLSSTGLAPFLVGGAGVIRFDPEGRDPSENIYLSGGAGIQLTGADRFALALQGQLLTYRYNPASTLLTAEDFAGLSTADRMAVNRDLLVRNLALRASLRLYLGGRRPGELTDVDRAYLEQFSGGLSGLSLQVEPFYGRLNFNDDLPYRDQSFVGAEAGVNLGPLVGLRGFYMRGVDSGDPFDFQPIQLFGGHAKLRLSEGAGVVPFITVGAGYLDVLSDYGELEAAELFGPRGGTIGFVGQERFEDKPFAQGGAGLEVPISPRLRLHGEARAFVISNQEAGDVSRPEEVKISPMYRGGLTFGLGGSTGDAPAVVTRAELERQLAEERREAAEEYVALEQELAEARLRGDSLAAARIEAEQARALEMATQQPAPAALEEPVMVRQPDGRVVVQQPAERRSGDLVVVGEEVRTAQGDRIVTIPLPEQGELYVRYGDPGGVQIESTFEGEEAGARAAAPASAQAAAPSDEELRALIREAVGDAVAAEGEAADEDARVADLERQLEDLVRSEIEREQVEGVSEAELELMERRLLDRLTDEIRDLRGDVRDDLRDDRDDAPVIVQTPQPGVVAPVTGQGAVAVAEPAVVERQGFVGISPVAGFAFGRGPEQVLIGLRTEYHPGGLSDLRYYPELLLGVGGERSFAFNVNGIFGVPGFDDQLAPYAGVGLGVVSYAGDGDDSGGNTDPFFGNVDDGGDDVPGFLLTLNLALGAEFEVGRNRVFTELNTANLTRFYRLLVGYRFDFD